MGRVSNSKTNGRKPHSLTQLLWLPTCVAFALFSLESFALPLSWNSQPSTGSEPGTVKSRYNACGFAKERSKELWRLLYAAEYGNELRPDFNPQTIQVAAGRNEWLAAMYQLGIVRATKRSRLLGDHLLAAVFLQRFAKKDYRPPKSIGLKCFLVQNNLVTESGEILRDHSRIREALETEFPHGFQVRGSSVLLDFPADQPVHLRPDPFISDLLKEDSPLYNPDELSTPFISPRVGIALSGERLIIQERPIQRQGKIVRVHTLNDKVVQDATLPRYPERDTIHEGERQAINNYVEEFLSGLPKTFLHGSAWAVDVFMERKSESLDIKVSLLDLHTNLGLQKPWSVFQSHPMILGAYTRHIEKYQEVKFAGVSGFLLRHNLGNLPKFLHKKLVRGWL